MRKSVPPVLRIVYKQTNFIPLSKLTQPKFWVGFYCRNRLVMNNRLNKTADEQTPTQNLQNIQAMFFKVSWSNFDPFEVKFLLI